MKYEFYTRPVIFVAPTTNKKYIVGVLGTGWIEYTDETYAEIMKQWGEWEQSKEKEKLFNQPEEFEVKSNSDPTKKYVVKKHRDGNWTCDCPGFGFRKNCSHIDKVKGNK
jgi:hypothetical protein